MGFYIVRRVAAIAVILVVISILIFAIAQALPGNVARMIAGQFATPDVIAAIETKLRLRSAGRPVLALGGGCFAAISASR